jgi:hypothetical protein
MHEHRSRDRSRGWTDHARPAGACVLLCLGPARARQIVAVDGQTPRVWAWRICGWVSGLPVRRLVRCATAAVLCCASTQMVLFDVQQRSVLAELATPFIKYVVWNADMTQVGRPACLPVRLSAFWCS